MLLEEGVYLTYFQTSVRNIHLSRLVDKVLSTGLIYISCQKYLWKVSERSQLLTISLTTDFRFGEFIREYMEETNKKLTYGDLWSLLGTETATWSECMLIMEMSRGNQAKVTCVIDIIPIFSISN